jgi:DNA-binding NarL/FixJ family response regulator
MPRQPLDSLIHLNDLCGFQYMSDEWSSVLSIREREVAFLVARGLANKEIARELGLSHGTVKQHVHSILLKLRSQKFLKSGTLNRYMLIHLINGSQRRDAADC